METLQVLPDTSSSDKEHGDSWKLQIGIDDQSKYVMRLE